MYPQFLQKDANAGLIRQSHLVNKDTSADSFLPLLILLLLRSNPPHLYSNIQYIQRFRSPERLGGEGGYYLNSLEAAVGWIEGIEKVDLTNSLMSGCTKLLRRRFRSVPFSAF
jgi:hypothetical protein